MDTVKFIIEEYVDEENGFRFPTINIYVNAVNLIDLVERVERSNQTEREEENSTSHYIGLEPDRSYAVQDEFLGRQQRPLSLLLTCTCTIELCNCILARITITEDTVTWSDIHSPWLGGKTPGPWVDEQEAEAMGWIPCDYSALGPFVFDHGQYMEALDDLKIER